MFKNLLTTKNLIFVAIVIGLIITLMRLDSCRNRDFRKQQASIDSLTLANQKFVEITNEKDQKIQKQELIITDNQADLKTLTLSLFDMSKREERLIKQVELLVQIKSRIHVEKVDVPYTDLAKEKRFSDSMERVCKDVIAFYRKNTVELTDTTSSGEIAKHVKIDSTQNKFFQFDGDVLKNGFRINNINFPDSQRIAVLEAKGGLFKRDINGKLKIFKRKTLEIRVIHTNPYIQVQGMSSVQYKPKVRGRWLERLVMVGIGAAGAIYLQK